MIIDTQYSLVMDISASLVADVPSCSPLFPMMRAGLKGAVRP